MCFLLKTRLDKEGFEKLYNNLPFSNRIIVKHPDSGGGLAFIWKNDVLMEVINFTANYVLAKVTKEDGFTWFLLFLGVADNTRMGKVVEVIGSLENICRWTLAMHW